MKWRFETPEFGAMERGAMRVLFALVVWGHIPATRAHLAISAPNGLARLVDLSFLLDPAVLAIFRYGLLAALVLYVLRIAWVIALPYMAALSIAVGSVFNSHGAISHTYQIVSLVLCAQTAAYFYGRFRSGSPPGSAQSQNENRMVFWSQQAIVATYLVSALTKLLHTSGMWFFQTPLMGVQIIKTTDQNFYNRLDAGGSEGSVAIAGWIAEHPVLAGVILGTGLLLELTAPVALLGRRWALGVGLSLLLFHETVHRVMKLHFVYNEYLLWIYLVNMPFWIFAGLALLRRRTSPIRESAGP